MLRRRCCFAAGLGLSFVLWLGRPDPTQAAISVTSSAGINLRPRVYDDFVAVTAKPRDAAEVDRLWQLAEHILAPHDPVVVQHSLVVTRATFERLRRAGLEVTVDATDVQQMVDESYTHNDTAELAAEDPAAFFAKVQPLDAIEGHLTDLVERSQGRAQLVTVGRSIQGRDLRALLISSRPADDTRASIIVTAAQHAREWLSPMVAMGIADGLVARYDTDEAVRRVVDNLNVYVVPVMNPDGYVRTFSGNRLQRKNMRVGCNVDINRNFPTGFGHLVSNNCNTETTSGPAAFSEPESQALRDLAAQLKKLRFYVDYHSSGNQVMIPYAYTRDEPPGFAKNQKWGMLLAQQARLPARPAFALAQGQGGGSLDWFREKYTESLVVELPGRGFDPPAAGVAASVDLQWKGWLAVAAIVAAENPADGSTPTAATDAGASAGAAGAPAGDAGAGSGGGVGPAGGSGGSGGETAGQGGSDGAGAGSGAQTDGAPGPVRSDAQELSGGCGCVIGSGGPAATPVALPALGLLGLALRRRRSRAATNPR